MQKNSSFDPLTILARLWAADWCYVTHVASDSSRAQKSGALSSGGYSLYSTCVLAYCVEQGPSWEANRSSAGKEIRRFLWNQKVRYRIYKCPPPVPLLTQTNPVHTPTSHFLNIHINIIAANTFSSNESATKQRDECTNTSLEPRICEPLFYLTTISCHVLSDCFSYQRSGLPTGAPSNDTRQ